jgi:NAD+ kinase
MSKIEPCSCVVLFVNLQKKNAASLADEIKTKLDNHSKKIDTFIFSFEGKPEPLLSLVTRWSIEGSPMKKLSSKIWDIAFTLGGDGTVLYAARTLAPLGVPILPINLGSLGFLAEVNKDDWFDVFLRWEKGEITQSRRCMFNITVVRDSKPVMENFCLNDAVISCTGIAKLIKLNVELTKNNQKDVIALGTYRCDGLIISTPTGSTAYSMAAGGPILDPEMEAVIINPICPFALSNRPFVLTSRQTVIVTVAENQRSRTSGSGVLLTIDGQDVFELKTDDKVYINQSPYNAQLIFPDKHAYYAALKNKLFWSPSLAEGDSHA